MRRCTRNLVLAVEHDGVDDGSADRRTDAAPRLGALTERLARTEAR